MFHRSLNFGQQRGRKNLKLVGITTGPLPNRPRGTFDMRQPATRHRDPLIPTTEALGLAVRP